MARDIVGGSRERRRQLVGTLIFVAVQLLTMADQSTQQIVYFSSGQLDAFHNLSKSWSETPGRETNLKGWPEPATNWRERISDWPCSSAGIATWKGVECLATPDLTSATVSGTSAMLMISLVLSNANIVGSLPIQIELLTPFLTLTLTENPKLTGSIPVELGNLSASLNTLDLHGNGFSGEIPQGINFSMFDNLRTLDLSSNSFVGQFPRLDFTYGSSLKYINMSRNSFNELPLGSLPISFNANSSLQILDLTRNNINGDVGEFNLFMKKFGYELHELYLDNNFISGILSLKNVTTLMSNLQNSSKVAVKISMTYNKITNVNVGNVDDYAVYDLSQFIKLKGNPFCERKKELGYIVECLCQDKCLLPPGVKKNYNLIIATATIVPSVLVVILIGIFLLHKSKKNERDLLHQVQQMCEEYDVKPTIFTYKELQIATRDFHIDMKLGEGAYGAVYKGVLPNKNVVAVKQLHINSQQGMSEFLNEVALITGMKHRNLVKLKGCCLREKERLLVYEYVDNHDLEWNLLDGKSNEILSWSKRFGICKGVANGLHYLHALAQPKVIHRDIKAANILLDNNFEPKIADFGLVFLFPEETTHILTLHVAGTKGYLAPEYASLGQLSEKADVYSFGVLCLEVVSGRRNVDNKMPLDEVVLANWAQKLYKEKKVMDILDPKLSSLNEDEVLQAQRVIYIALLCLQHSQDLRPTMARVVSVLEGDLNSHVVEILDITEKYAPLSLFDMISFQMSQSGLETLREDDSIQLFEGQLSNVGEISNDSNSSVFNIQLPNKVSIR